MELWKWKNKNDADNVEQKTTRASRVTCFKGIVSSSSHRNRISANFDRQKNAVTPMANRNTGFIWNMGSHNLLKLERAFQHFASTKIISPPHSDLDNMARQTRVCIMECKISRQLWCPKRYVFVGMRRFYFKGYKTHCRQALEKKALYSIVPTTEMRFQEVFAGMRLSQKYF